MIPLTGTPWTPFGAALEKSPAAQLTAKAFLVAYGFQFALTFGPMMVDPGSIIRALSNPVFDYTFFNGTLGKGLMAAWTITMSNPLDKTLTPPVTLTQLPPKQTP